MPPAPRRETVALRRHDRVAGQRLGKAERLLEPAPAQEHALEELVEHRIDAGRTPIARGRAGAQPPERRRHREARPTARPAVGSTPPCRPASCRWRNASRAAASRRPRPCRGRLLRPPRSPSRSRRRSRRRPRECLARRQGRPAARHRRAPASRRALLAAPPPGPRGRASGPRPPGPLDSLSCARPAAARSAAASRSCSARSCSWLASDAAAVTGQVGEQRLVLLAHAIEACKALGEACHGLASPPTAGRAGAVVLLAGIAGARQPRGRHGLAGERRPRRVGAPPRAPRASRARARGLGRCSAAARGPKRGGTTRPRARPRRRPPSPQPASRRPCAGARRPRSRDHVGARAVARRAQAGRRRPRPAPRRAADSVEETRSSRRASSLRCPASCSVSSTCERSAALEPAPERVELTARQDAAGAPAAR